MIDYDAFFSRAAGTMQESAIRKMGGMGGRVPDMISFAAGFPAPETFAWAELQTIAAELLTGRDGTVLQYGPTRGYRPLIEALPEILAVRGIQAAPEHLLVTTGSQQGLDLVARILVDPGDVVLVELPTYTGAITAFRNSQASLAGVRQDQDGVDLDDLDTVLARERAAGGRVRCLYLTPNFQNPSGLLLSLDRRRRLLDWADRHDLLIVEDDPYGALYFEDSASAADTRPIKADDRHGRVIYLSSFSKTLAPGFRVAWVVAPPALAAKLEVAKESADLSAGVLDQRIVHEALKRGVLDRQVPGLREHYRHKRDVMARALRGELGDRLRWPDPRGGFFLWVTLPDGIDADAMLARAMSKRVIYVAGSAFFVGSAPPNLVRLSFSAPSPARIVEGVRRLATAVREELAAQHASQPA